MIDRAACRPVLKDLDTGPERAVDSCVSLDFRENVPIIPTHSFLLYRKLLKSAKMVYNRLEIKKA